MASLAGKADPTIVRFAYAAGMANVPGDYSKYYQSTVDAHKELMGGIEEMAATFKLENDIATLEFKKAMSVFNDPLNVQMIDSDYTEMQNDVKIQREEWKANKGFKNDPEGRQDWDRRNNQIIGRHEQDNANLGTLQAGVEGNLYDIENMEIGKKKFLTNLAKYQANQDKESGKHNVDATRYMKDNPNATSEDLWKNLGELEEGVVVKFKDPKTGEYTYISKVGEDPKTKKPIIESQKSSELLDYANEDARADGTLVKAKALYQNALKTAKGTELGYDGFRTTHRNDLEEILDTDELDNPNTLGYMMSKKIGGEKLSFAEALRSGKALGLTNDIIVALGATKSDGDNILEESDFATAQSYNTVVNSILSGTATYDENGKPKSVDTKGLYLDYTIDNAFETGHNQYKKLKSGAGTDTDGKGGKYGGWLQYRVKTGGGGGDKPASITWATATQRRGYLDNFDQVDGEHGSYIWNADLGDNGMYVRDDDKEMSMFEVARDEGLIKPGESAKDFNPKTKTEQNLDEDRKGAGLATSSIMTTGGDNTVSDALNEMFGLTGGKEPFIFAPWSSHNKTGANYKIADAIGTNDITILKPAKVGTGAFPILDENGNQYRFKIGDEFTQSDLDIINQIMEDAGYVRKQTPVDDATTYTTP